MTAPDFDAALVEQAADAAFFADPARRVSKAQAEAMALAVLTVVAPALRAKGAAVEVCPCSTPGETHHVGLHDYQRGMVAGARQVFAAVDDWRISAAELDLEGHHEDADRLRRRWTEVREAVARIEKGGE